MRLSRVIIFSGILLFVSCKETEVENKRSQQVETEVIQTEVYVCPSGCENGMNYYLEGKCDICHDNLVLKE